MAERLQRGMWSGGRLIGIRDMSPKFSGESPVRYGEGLTFTASLSHITKPDRIPQTEWDNRLVAVKLLGEIGRVVPQNDITATECGAHVSSSFKIEPSLKRDIPAPFTVDCFPLWDILLVGSSEGVRTQISLEQILAATDVKSRNLAKDALQAQIVSAATAKLTEE